MITSDFLVIGSGVAGLSFALRAAEHGKVIVLCKSDPLVSSSAKAQGGIAAVMDKNDSFEEHIADTLDAGAGLCDEAAVRTIVTEAPEAIRELLSWGVDFDQEEDGEFELGREGGHGKRRILHAKDTTGLEISSKLLKAAQRHPNIELLDHRIAIDLITTAKLGCVTEDRVLGAYVLNPATGAVDIFRCDRILLATGGTGRVYMYTTNPATATGDGVAMAWPTWSSCSSIPPPSIIQRAATVRDSPSSSPKPYAARAASCAGLTARSSCRSMMSARAWHRAISWPAPSTAKSSAPATPACIWT